MHKFYYFLKLGWTTFIVLCEVSDNVHPYSETRKTTMGQNRRCDYKYHTETRVYPIS